MKGRERLQGLVRNGMAVKKTDFPGFREPMLATLTEDHFDDADWIYERKLDGIRCQVLKCGESVRLISRNQKDLSATFPELVRQASALCSEDFIADGEIVAFEGSISSFSKLQDRLPIRESPDEAATSPKVWLYLFDLMYYKGYLIEEAPLLQRKLLLKDGMSWSRPFRYTAYRKEHGNRYFQEACRKGWEGLIAKDGHATYLHSRSGKWLKFKCVNQQELVIGGYTEPKGERIGFGALLVGFYKRGKLLFAGKVGTGFDNEFLKEWRPRLEEIRAEKSPFDDYANNRDGKNHWVKPDFVGEFAFTEWTVHHKLRHPSFVGIRYDKAPEEVHQETVHENIRN